MKQEESADRGEALLAEYRASKQTRKAFCGERGIAVSTLDYYLSRAARRRKREAPLLRVEMKPAEARAASGRCSGVAITRGNGWRLELERGFDEAVLRRVLAVVGGQ
jgi:hypothetical protein